MKKQTSLVDHDDIYRTTWSLGSGSSQKMLLVEGFTREIATRRERFVMIFCLSSCLSLA